MARIEMDLDTALPPERVREALIDFTDRRPSIWPGLAPEYYEVYEVGDTWARVREGSTKPARVWAKERYDWSDPNTVTWVVEESDFQRPGSFVSATASPRSDGGSHVHITWNREPANARGRFIITLLWLTRGAMIRSYVKRTLDGLARRGSS